MLWFAKVMGARAGQDILAPRRLCIRRPWSRLSLVSNDDLDSVTVFGTQVYSQDVLNGHCVSTIIPEPAQKLLA